MAIFATTYIDTKFGKLKTTYHESDGDSCVAFTYGDIEKNTPIVRIHSACLFSEVFSSKLCDCYPQLLEAFKMIKAHGAGVVVYAYKEGRGIGLKDKIRAMEIERTQKCDTVEAYKRLGLDRPDFRTYLGETGALKDLKCAKTIIVFSGNPSKLQALKKAGFRVIKIVEAEAPNLSVTAEKERLVKKNQLGYSYKK